VKDDRVYLQHIRDALDDIATYSSAGRGAFFAERMRQDATIRKFQVIGECCRVRLQVQQASSVRLPGIDRPCDWTVYVRLSVVRSRWTSVRELRIWSHHPPHERVLARAHGHETPHPRSVRQPGVQFLSPIQHDDDDLIAARGISASIDRQIHGDT
jgi:hypothetical protein